MEGLRIGLLNDRPADQGGRYVLYWMQQAQRASFNHALEHAIALANERGQGVVVGFGLTDGYPDANLRHYAFMLEGLKETAATLEHRGIRFVLRRGDPADVALGLAREASVAVCDKGYLRHQRAWRQRVAEEAGRQVVEVEGEVVVPVGLASTKAEIGARTLRPRILRLREEFLRPLAEEAVRVPSLGLGLAGNLDPADVEGSLRALAIDRSVPPSRRFRGGTAAARARLAAFLEEKLAGYATGRNEPAAGQSSHLSPYLHFGQISPVEVALAAATRPAGDVDRAAFLEELIVRRELSHNFVTYNPATTVSTACRAGPRKRWTSIATTPVRRSTGSRNSKRGRRTIRTSTPQCARCGSPASCRTTCACTGARRSSNYAQSRGGLRHNTQPQQQALPVRPGPQRLRQRGLGVWPARPAVAGTADFRPGPLHERQGPRAEVRYPGLCAMGGRARRLARQGLRKSAPRRRRSRSRRG